MTYINYMFQQRLPKHVGVYACRVLYYQVHLSDDILMTLRQHSFDETGENNENRKPSPLHVYSVIATPTCLRISNGNLKRIFRYNFIDLMNEVSVTIWTVGSPFQLLALSRCCRNVN